MEDKKLYILEKILRKESYYEVIMCGDWNDGDYVSKTKKYNQEEFNNIVSTLIHYTNFYSEKCESNYFYDNIPIPHGHECDCHTTWVESIKFYDTDGTVSNVKLTDDKDVLHSISLWEDEIEDDTEE